MSSATNNLKKTAAIIGLTAVWGIAHAGIPATLGEACEDRSNKLAMVYGLLADPTIANLDWRKPKEQINLAERIVRGAYGEIQSTSDREWPGLWDWSVVNVLHSMVARLKQEEAYLTFKVSCMKTFLYMNL